MESPQYPPYSFVVDPSPSPIEENELYYEGRRLAAQGHCPLPVDEEEMERLQNIHNITHAVLGSHYYGPVDRVLSKPSGGNRRRIVIDVGTGNGAWVREMAALFPLVSFVGVDIVPIPPPCHTGSLLGPPTLIGAYEYRPPRERENVRFERGDLTKGLDYPDGEFDVVHCRSVLALAIPQYVQAVTELTRILRPGGLLLLAESTIPFCDSAGQPYHPNSASGELINAIHTALKAAGMDPDVRLKLEGLVRRGPFAEVRAKEVVIPLGEWPEDPRLQQIGLMGREALEMSLRALTPLLRQGKPIAYDDGMISWLLSRIHAELDAEQKGRGHGVSSVATYVWAKRR
ncbi:hypothetical protein FRC03_006541 [Tulasnella sp. 419]|nr:hypothetical protein FRC02_000831 [Tulasnella sp. 418]KAG8960421.1 hypothetical protein FRC03_006541 [Tulasnella sp. 419]